VRLFGCFLCTFLVLLGVIFAFFGVKTAWRAAIFGIGSGQRSAAQRAVYNNIIIYGNDIDNLLLIVSPYGETQEEDI
jgi:hypothetical protein